MNGHFKQYHGDKSLHYKCDQCDFSSFEKNKLKRHKKTQHEKPTEFKCEFCPYVTNLRGIMNKHIKHKHQKVKEYPFVSIAPVDGSILPTITFDSYEGGRLAGETLIDSGFEKFGIITGPMVKWEANLRKNGFNDVLRKNGFLVEWEYQGDYSFSSGEAALKDVQKNEIRGMGIFSSNDQMALGFLHTALENGMTIPGDFGIVGYDNMPYSKVFYPKLTTISTDLNLLAEATLDSIRTIIKSKSGKKTNLTTTLLPVEVVKRRTHIK